MASYRDLHDAAHRGDIVKLQSLIKSGITLEARDWGDRTPLRIAAFASRYKAVRVLTKASANLNAFENDAYDIVTIAAVTNDLKMVDLAIRFGTSTTNITSSYDGTAQFAAAHRGHYQVVRRWIISITLSGSR